MLLFRDTKLNNKKDIRVSLNAIWGVSWRKSINICSQAGISYPFFTINLNSYRFRLVFFLLKTFVCSDVRVKRLNDYNISILKLIKSYKGQCHKLFLPVRGQRTRTNAWTQRNKRRSSNTYKKEVIQIK